MDHKEYSSAGSEFFPSGQEFSSAQQEFPKLSPEILPAATEADQSGSEFHQSSGPDQKAEKKRRRSISPAMLTTAAVVTAAVIVSPLSSHVTGNQSSASSYPNLELSAQSKAYLDEVWDALPTGDMEQFISLVTDERLRTLAVEEVPPYMEMLERQYGFDHHHDYCEWCNNTGEFTLLEGFHHSPMHYSGEFANATIRGMNNNFMYFEYERYIFSDSPEDTHQNANFHRLHYAPDGGSFEGYWLDFYQNNYEDQHESVYIDYENGHWEQAKFEGHSYHALKTGYICNYSISRDLSSDTPNEWIDTTRAEGEFTAIISPSDDPEFLFFVENCLANGTITLSQTNPYNPEYSYSIQLDVIDCIVQITDDIIIEYDEVDGYYNLHIKTLVESAGGEYYQEYVQTIRAESEEELLHTSNWYSANTNYYLSR